MNPKLTVHISEFETALVTINQSLRIVDRSIETTTNELKNLELQGESILFDGSLNRLDAQLIEYSIAELEGTIQYLKESKNHINRLEADIRTTIANNLQ